MPKRKSPSYVYFTNGSRLAMNRAARKAEQKLTGKAQPVMIKPIKKGERS